MCSNGIVCCCHSDSEHLVSQKGQLPIHPAASVCRVLFRNSCEIELVIKSAGIFSVFKSFIVNSEDSDSLLPRLSLLCRSLVG